MPENVRRTTGKFLDAEFEIMKTHSEKGVDLLKLIKRDVPEEILEIVRHHHERWDGSGYPDGIKGVNIPLGSRIIALADSYDAVTKVRGYKPILSHDEAIIELNNDTNYHKLYDPDLLRIFISKEFWRN